MLTFDGTLHFSRYNFFSTTTISLVLHSQCHVVREPDHDLGRGDVVAGLAVVHPHHLREGVPGQGQRLSRAGNGDF